MRTLITALAACALVPLLGAPAGAATAAPVPTGPAALTKNPIYRTGALPAQACKEPLFSDTAGFRRYVRAMAPCFDRMWQAQLRKAGLPYTRARIVIKTGSQVSTPCGRIAPIDTLSLYCVTDHKIYLLASQRGLRGERDTPRALESLAVGYAHHVQHLTGILAEAQRVGKPLPAARRNALLSKFSLQSQCLGGAALAGVWNSLGHTRRQGADSVLDRSRTDNRVEAGAGSPANRSFWMRRGFESRSPGSCNTFTAPAARVA